MIFHSTKCCLGPIHTTKKLSVFDQLSAQTSKEPRTRRKRKTKKSHLTAASVNMTSRRDPTRSRRGRQGVRASSVSFPNPDYRSGLSQVLIEPEGAFRDTRSRVAMPYNYEQPSSFTRVVLNH